MKKMTKKALEEAFAGESMAHMKYAIFAEIAESEGFRNISRLFRAISYAELVHARNHARELGYLGKTPENLQSGIEGETFEIEEMYPVYRATAEMQGESGAVRSTTYALEAERIHANMYKDAK
ncbi:MAG: rubrerythrin family protein, partial [Thermoplasmata archaeon]|nr:rubrerythrin family protein [Thermoplasmata archaeon]